MKEEINYEEIKAVRNIAKMYGFNQLKNIKVVDNWHYAETRNTGKSIRVDVKTEVVEVYNRMTIEYEEVE